MTTRKKLEYWTEVHRVMPDNTVKVTTCCCDAPGMTRVGCSVVRGRKNPCRCYCHKTTVDKPRAIHGRSPPDQRRQARPRIIAHADAKRPKSA